MSSRILFLAALGLAAGSLSPLLAEDTDAVSRQEDERLLREAKVTPNAPGLLSFFKKRSLGEEDRQTIERLIVQLGSRRFPLREQASRQLEEWGTPALNYLASAARVNSDLEIVRRAERCIEAIQRGPGPALPCAAARQIARLAPTDAVAVLIDYLPYAEDESIQDEVFLALLSLGKDPARQAPLPPALRDSAPLKRAAAGYVLGRWAEGKQRDEVRRLLHDVEPIVRLRAAQGLLAGKDRLAVPALVDLLTCPLAEIAWQAEDLLQRAAGDLANVPTVEEKDGSRRDYRDRWAKWWEANAAKVELERVEQEPPQRGWTVVAQMSTGKVYEVDRQGKTRWCIDNLSGPIDAQILSGDRVLVAEHHGSRVTERNLQGNVLWEKKLDDRPVQAMRLPGGNTFICTYSAVMEVKRDGTVVYSHRPEGTAGQIYAGHKLRNGRIVCITLEGRILEMEAASGKVLKSIASGLSGCYSVQALPRGNFLVSSYNDGKVHEVDPAGKIVWRYELASAYHAERLPNGNTLVSSHGGSRVVEIDRTGKTLNEHATSSNNVWRVHRR